VEAAVAELSEMDRHIIDGMAGLLDGSGGLKRVRKLQEGSLSFDREAWGRLATLGWIGAAVPEAQGGTGLSLREIALLLEHAGKRLMPEPLVLALAGSRILARTQSPLLAEVLTGNVIAVPVDAAAFDGVTAYVSDGHVGDVFLALIGEEAYAIPRGTAGVTVESEETVDGGSITRLRLGKPRKSDLTFLAKGEAAVAAFADAQDLARLGYAALLTGLMDQALQMTVQYMKDRRQFGVPIGSFQALQHRAASLYIVAKASRALLYEACRAVPPRRSIAALSAKSYAAETAMQTVKECVQLHGAMGYTAEHDMSLFFRRAMALSVAGGDAIACRKLLHAEGEKLQEMTGSSR
jgi:alkylation response protein AidB-like acyl-CoA dehydrogenase